MRWWGQHLARAPLERHTEAARPSPACGYSAKQCAVAKDMTLERQREKRELPSLVTIVEVATVVLSILIALWVVVPLMPGSPVIAVPALLACSLIVYSQYIRGESLEELGLTRTNFGRAGGLLWLPTLLASLVLFGIGWRSSTLRIDGSFLLKLTTLPIWGLIQQYILQAFIYRRMRAVLGQRAVAGIIAAGLFALVHLPNPMLTILTFAGALVWIAIYERAPNLYALGLSHGIVSLVVMITVPHWMLPSLSVGYKYLFYQSP